MAYPKTSVAERFAQKFIPEPNSGCWLWIDAPDGYGYGRLQVGGKARKAHRVSYELHCGPVENHMLVCHRCDNRACVNPDHLFLGSHDENVADMVGKGRAPHVKNPSPGERNGRACLTEAQAIEIIALHAAGNYRLTEIAARFGVKRDVVAKITEGRTWRHLPRLPLSATKIGRWGTKRSRAEAALIGLHGCNSIGRRAAA